MKNLRNKLIQGGIYLSCIAFGYVLTRFIDIPHFEISKTIDISNVLTLIITAWLAILITTVFEKQNNDHRVEKDLIITRVGNIYDIAASLQIESNSGRVHITEASSSLKRINTALNSIYRIVEKCHFNITDDLKDRLKLSLSDIRTTLTNTPLVTDEQLNAQDLPIEIKDSIIHFNKERVSQLEVKFDTLKDLLLELQIHINKK
jgi:hypothetical protein